MKLTHLLVALFLFAGVSFAQMRPPEREEQVKTVKPLPATIVARYEGGIFGYSDTESGTLKFDDANERMTFHGSDGKEWLNLGMAMTVPMKQSALAGMAVTSHADGVPCTAVFSGYSLRR